MDFRNLEVAVCKPDHIGDFVLALPALRRLQALGCRLTLFIAKPTLPLARYLVPDADLVPLDLPYLRRDLPSGAWTDVYQTLGRLRIYDSVFFFRRDGFFTPHRFAQLTDFAFFIEDRQDRHQTGLEHDALAPAAGAYDVDALFFEERTMTFPLNPNTIAFAVGAGFPHKKWSPLAWAELGHLLRDRGINVRVLSGPGEIEECRLIARAIGLDDQRDVFVGGFDFAALDDWLDTLDLVVAADGGTAHLCSRRVPVVTVFGPSPYRRFAPTGAANRVVTRDLVCSPCVGFEASTINACLSRECLYNLSPVAVLQAIFNVSRPPGECLLLDGGRNTRVHFGLSVA